MKDKNNVFIRGDSYSTYEGYIPKGYHFYYSDERKENPIVNGVEKTWQNMLANKNNLNIILTELGMKQISEQVMDCLHKK